MKETQTNNYQFQMGHRASGPFFFSLLFHPPHTVQSHCEDIAPNLCDYLMVHLNCLQLLARQNLSLRRSSFVEPQAHARNNRLFFFFFGTIRSFQCGCDERCQSHSRLCPPKLPSSCCLNDAADEFTGMSSARGCACSDAGDTWCPSGDACGAPPACC